MNWIKEENYAEEMKTVAEPYVRERGKRAYFERVPGQKIAYVCFNADSPKGIIVISHGFTESYRKYVESVYYMLQAGYSVCIHDHRGHGRSYRSNDNAYVVHVGNFEDYVLDLVYMTNTIAKKLGEDLPLYLYGHSMGGCVGAWVIEEYPDLFKKAVLSSPMLGLKFNLPTPVMVAGATVLGVGERKKNSLERVDSFPTEPDFENSCDSSKCRYLYYHAKRLGDIFLQTTSPSIGWGLQSVRACKKVTSKKQMAKIKIPVLLFQAGNDTVVDNSAQNLFSLSVPSCEFRVVPGMKHELYMTDSEVLIPYWEKIFSWFK